MVDYRKEIRAKIFILSIAFLVHCFLVFIIAYIGDLIINPHPVNAMYWLNIVDVCSISTIDTAQLFINSILWCVRININKLHIISHLCLVFNIEEFILGVTVGDDARIRLLRLSIYLMV